MFWRARVLRGGGDVLRGGGDVAVRFKVLDEVGEKGISLDRIAVDDEAAVLASARHGDVHPAAI